MSKREVMLSNDTIETVAKYVIERLIETICKPSNFIDLTVIDDIRGENGHESYMLTSSKYHNTEIYLNVQAINTRDDLIDSIAHEAIHSMSYKVHHYNAVIKNLIPENTKLAVETLYNQLDEGIVEIWLPIMKIWVDSVVMDYEKEHRCKLI